MTGERKAASKSDPVRLVGLIDNLSDARRKVSTIELALCGLGELASNNQCEDVRSVAAETAREIAEVVEGLTSFLDALPTKKASPVGENAHV